MLWGTLTYKFNRFLIASDMRKTIIMAIITKMPFLSGLSFWVKSRFKLSDGAIPKLWNCFKSRVQISYMKCTKVYWVLVIPTAPKLGRNFKIGKSKGIHCFPTSPLLAVLATRVPPIMFLCRSLNLAGMKEILSILGSLTEVEIVVVNWRVIMIEVAKGHNIIYQWVASRQRKWCHGTSYANCFWLDCASLGPINVWLLA